MSHCSYTGSMSRHREFSPATREALTLFADRVRVSRRERRLRAAKCDRVGVSLRDPQRDAAIRPSLSDRLRGCHHCRGACSATISSGAI